MLVSVNGIMGKKIRMSRIYTEEKIWIPVTLVWVPKAKVIEKTGNTISLGYDQCRSKIINKPQRVIFDKLGDDYFRHRKNFTLIDGDLNVGDYVTGSNFFSDMQNICVTGTTAGKGFSGVMAAHGFAGLRATHGTSLKHRSGGSTGCRTHPGKVFKGKKMAKNMGNRTEHKHSTVIKWHPEQEIAILYGSIPGKCGWVKLWQRV